MDENLEIGRSLKDKLGALETELSTTKRSLVEAASLIPNDTHPDSPIGPESAARLLGVLGSPRKFPFPPKDHLALGSALGLWDFEASTRSSGSGFVTLKGAGVALELALVQWALSRLTDAGFTVLAPPDVALSSVLEGCGFSPRSGPSGAASQIYSLMDTPLCLVGTSEIPLAVQHAVTSAPPSPPTTPTLYAAWGRCFRREAGGAGSTNKGLYRLHQFTKVEMFAYVARGTTLSSPRLGDSTTFRFPELARVLLPSTRVVDGELSDCKKVSHTGAMSPCSVTEAVFARLVDLQASLVSELGLCARVLDMPTEELGASAYRKVDIEVWMPGKGSYGEVSSASNCMDYQARRLGIRYKQDTSPPAFFHTLNATAAAVPRLLLSILETHQQEDGSVDIPQCLHPWLGGLTRLKVGCGVAPVGKSTPAFNL